MREGEGLLALMLPPAALPSLFATAETEVPRRPRAIAAPADWAGRVQALRRSLTLFRPAAERSAASW